MNDIEAIQSVGKCYKRLLFIAITLNERFQSEIRQ